MEKVCTKCNLQKPLEEFVKSKKGKFGKTSWCKLCINKDAIIRRENNSKSLHERQKEFIQNNKKIICTKCSQEKPYDKFYPDKNSKTGFSYWCKDCRIKHAASRKNKDSIRHKESKIKNPEFYLHKWAKYRANKRGIPFHIEISDIYIPKICPVLGIPIIIGSTKTIDNSPSLDRINSELGYIPSNIIVMSWKANIIKSYGTAEEHLKIYNFLKQHELKKEI